MSNHLADQTSPYLRQHANNPVDWWPWCEEALATARRERKPILLSIGYAACHWCHVMAHESFEDPATAELMNRLYVNIKVDREERPDLDRIYQLAHQALTQRSGGWPLTVFLTPDDLVPFMSGTYFPKLARADLPAFTDMLLAVRRWYDGLPEEVRARNRGMAAFLAGFGRDAAHQGSLDDTPIRSALERLREEFDPLHGGQRGAPKFPQPGVLALLLAREPGEAEPARMARVTLERMAAGGLFDHAGGGFFRYAVDAAWNVPHFEKMLPESAQLLPLLAEAACAFGSAELAAAATMTADWLVREMGTPQGGFASSLDADSDGEEGRFYLWQASEVRALLEPREYAVAAARFGLDRAANFRDRAWHLRVVARWEDVAAALGLSVTQARHHWETARAKLLAARAGRTPPGLDHKILAGWNALAIGGCARAQRAGAELGTLPAACDRALAALRGRLWLDGRLHAVLTDGSVGGIAFLDDHAFLLAALLERLQLRWDGSELAWAIELADALLAHHEDRELGGFYFTADDAEALPQRPKSWLDEATPSGNGIAARALLQLGHLLGEPRYLGAAERTLRAAWPALAAYPQACPTLLLALEDHLSPRPRIVLRADAAEHAAWQDALAGFRHAEVYVIPPQAAGLPALLAAQAHRPGGIAYLCRGSACEAPLAAPEALLATAAPRHAGG